MPCRRERRAHGLLTGVVLVEHALARHLVDVSGRRSTRSGNRACTRASSIWRLSRLSTTSFEPFLRGYDQPKLAPVLLDRLRQTLEIEHAIDAAGHVLADLVDHEDEPCGPATATSNEFLRPHRKPVGIDLGLRRLASPRVHFWVVSGRSRCKAWLASPLASPTFRRSTTSVL